MAKKFEIRNSTAEFLIFQIEWKDYLKESELEDMGRIVNSFLDLAEDMAKRHIRGLGEAY